MEDTDCPITSFVWLHTKPPVFQRLPTVDVWLIENLFKWNSGYKSIGLGQYGQTLGL